jgi:hypothetical protein
VQPPKGECLNCEEPRKTNNEVWGSRGTVLVRGCGFVRLSAVVVWAAL